MNVKRLSAFLIGVVLSLSISNVLAADGRIQPHFVRSGTISSTDSPPVLAPIGPKCTAENMNLNFIVSASDIESIPLLAVTNLPFGAGFTDNGDGTGVFDWTPNSTQLGVFNVTFFATDDSLTVDFETVAITVTESGSIIVINSIGLSFTATQGGALPVTSMFNFSINSGSSSFHNWSVADDASWLTPFFCSSRERGVVA